MSVAESSLRSPVKLRIEQKTESLEILASLFLPSSDSKGSRIKKSPTEIQKGIIGMKRSEKTEEKVPSNL